jgi:DNA polymerase-3 subunit beta
MSRASKNQSSVSSGLDISIRRADLLGGLRIAQSIADRQSTMPMLANVLLRTTGAARVILVATDLNVSVTTEVPSTNACEGGIAISAKALHDVVAGLPEEEIRICRIDNGQAEVSSGRVRFKLLAMSDRDFPKIPDHASVELTEIDGAGLADMLGRVSFSMCTDETRFHLNGAYLETDGAVVRVVSTDGHRLTKMERELPGMPSLSGPGIIIPRKAVAEIRRVLESGAAAFIAVKQPNIFVRCGTMVLAAKLTDSQFPPYDQVIPKEHANDVLINRQGLLSALRRTKLMTTDSRGVTFSVEANRLVISSENPDAGEVREEMEVEYAGAEMRIGFNPRYVLDLLSNISQDRVRLELGESPLDPGVLRPVDGDDYLGVIMPMRV